MFLAARTVLNEIAEGEQTKYNIIRKIEHRFAMANS
jgi:hypothetical protein